jgi:hypothetical protein
VDRLKAKVEFLSTEVTVDNPERVKPSTFLNVSLARPVSSEKLTQSGLLRGPIKGLQQRQSQLPWLESEFQMFWKERIAFK